MVAIMMLLVITLLALSSMRGVSLESRITGNLRLQKTLSNAAEGGLRIAENSISTSQAPTVLKVCTPAVCMPWLKSEVPVTADVDTKVLFTSAYATNVANATTNYDVKVQWYVVDLGNLIGSSQNNCALTGCGPHYYEINACASTVACTSDTATQRVILRSVIARYY